jgi:hypothetical protein
MYIYILYIYIHTIYIHNNIYILRLYDYGAKPATLFCSQQNSWHSWVVPKYGIIDYNRS